MKVVEYGENQPQVVLLLHGGGLSWWSYREVAHRLQAHYHVVLPVWTDMQSGVPFVSIEEKCSKIDLLYRRALWRRGAGGRRSFSGRSDSC